MKPAPFDYVRATSVDEAVAALTASDGEAKLLAGGQSLVPMLNFRLVDAPVFVDINGIDGLAGIEETDGGGLRVGALTRHHTLETSGVVRDRFPVVHEAMKHVAHLAIRNRGTIGGSLSHSDPAAELPAMTVLLEARIEAVGPNGTRQIPADEFFIAPLTTVLEPDEIVTAVYLPGLPTRSGWGFEEFAQRRGDYAIAGAAAVVTRKGEQATWARIALFGVDDTPVWAKNAEKVMISRGIDAAAKQAAADVEPMSDLHGSSDYRRHLAEVMVRRALTAAMERAGA
jgi:carbon-monoxide dehydrogenase medium subunit|tara:strand:+ start:451 stop:1305 length:855 start_codon:yes stop_codon:yes gene_type:complete